MIQVSITDRAKVIKWCINNVSPTEYYLHNRIGGVGWTLYFDSSLPKHWNLKVDDEKLLTLLLLSLR